MIARPNRTPLRLSCSFCHHTLNIIGRFKYMLHTKCPHCGHDSSNQIKDNNTERNFENRGVIKTTPQVQIFKRRAFG
jgi:hypothetical protein